jgi:Fe-S-cluster containining protein
MVFENIFQHYEELVKKADASFHRMETDYGECMGCRIHCSDCCHALFGLFLIEAAYIQEHFQKLPGGERSAALLRADNADMDLKKVEVKLQRHGHDPQMRALTLARERVRCPLLDQNEECILYTQRPITCRVYGIPTAIQGKVRVCPAAAFKPEETYPVFDLDGVYKALYQLSKEILVERGAEDLEKASLLVSVSKALKTPAEEILAGKFG